MGVSLECVVDPVRGWWGYWVGPYWKSYIALLTPLVLLPLPAVIATSEARCGYVILVMAVYWMTETLPVAITALIPVFAFPLLGILSTGDVCIVYMKETNMMFLGGLAVAIAVEHCNLHKRIALFVILHVGQSPRRLMAGFMLTTMFLSMWISNTASTAMMVPIVDAILAELYQSREDDIGELERRASSPPAIELTNGKTQEEASGKAVAVEEAKEGLTVEPPDEECRALRDMCFLAVAYSANLGGTGSLTGTGPNLVVKEVLSSSFSEPTGLNFASWMAYNVPGMLLCVVLAWFWLQVMFLGICCKKGSISNTTPEKEAAVRRLIRGKYKQLGPMTHHEATVLTLFIILVLLWTFRAPEFIPGWSHLFTDAFPVHANGRPHEVDDATPAMLVMFLLFVLPAKLNFWCFNKGGEAPKEPSPACLTWDVVQKKIPWGIVLLLGGGFAMAEASKQSGLNTWLGEQLVYFNVMPKEAIVFVVSLMTAMVTEVASNTATASILLPVLQEMAIKIEVNPLYLMLPAAICCSYAFMLPVATPPNAIVFAAANMRSVDMMKAGFCMNVICVLVCTLMINTLGIAMFDLNHMPAWINSTITQN